MQTSSQLEQSFEYNPLQTEIENDNQERSYASDNNNTIHYSQENEQPNREPGNCSALNSKIPSDSFDTLHSLRISRSVSGKKDNENMLLKGINKAYLHTPEKDKSNKIVIGALFDYSTTNNKNVMVSELDIQITSNLKLKGNQQDERYHYTHFNTVSNENRRNLQSEFDNKIMQRINAIGTNNQGVNKKNLDRPSTKMEVSKTPLIAHQSRIHNKIPPHASNLPMPRGNEIEINKSNRKGKICSSMKKMSCKTAIYEILQRLKDKSGPSSSKNKNSGGVSYLSTNYQDMSMTNKHSSFQRNSILAKKTPMVDAPVTSSFKYNETKIPKRPESLKQKDCSLSKEFNGIASKHNKDKASKYHLTYNNFHATKTTRISTLSNSRSKTKKKNEGPLFLKMNNTIFNTLQSLCNQRIKKSLLNTISNTKTTKTHFPHQKASILKAKKKVSKPEKPQKKSNYLTTEKTKTRMNETDQSYQSKVRVQAQTPLALKPSLQIYKNSIKQVGISPMTAFTMKWNHKKC